MTRKRLSIILATRDPGPALDGTIESVLSQHHEAVELIIVDGGSTDCTVATLQRYGAKLLDETIADHAGGGISERLSVDLLRDVTRLAREAIGIHRYLRDMQKNARERLTGAPHR